MKAFSVASLAYNGRMDTPATPPICYVIGGPNGAGKTSAALRILPQLGCLAYVNADAIAAALSPFQPEKSAIEAGRMMLSRIHDLAAQQKTFAFESTLASRSFAPFLKQRKADGYQIVLLYFYLASPELAIARVRARVAAGGHHIPEADIRRRYERSLNNLNSLYLPLVDAWEIYDNSGNSFTLVAWGNGKQSVILPEGQQIPFLAPWITL
jgi:predicted ABC-type ATPase